MVVSVTFQWIVRDLIGISPTDPITRTPNFKKYTAEDYVNKSRRWIDMEG